MGSEEKRVFGVTWKDLHKEEKTGHRLDRSQWSPVGCLEGGNVEEPQSGGGLSECEVKSQAEG